MPGLLDGKVAFVTGGAGGIGRATALALAAEGAKVAVADLNAAAAAETAALIVQAGSEAWSSGLDVTDKAAVDACVDGIVARWGRLDIGFNNAGVSLEDYGVAWDDLTRIDKTMDINYRGVLLCMSAELRHMLPAGRGSIISTSSIAGVSGAGGTGYCASKHAVIGLTRAVASRHAATGVRINAVCPGVIETNMTKQYLDNPEGRKMLGALVPMGRFGRPEDIANAVVFLASDKASFITGHPLVVDGGHMAA
jgi:NAD(P)-dependent dehydrogenase (short-subunit alcohol dehydrogenase family)